MGCGDPGREVEGGTARTVQQVEGERHRDGPLEVGGREGREGVGGAPKGRAGTRRETMGCGDPGREVEGGTARTVQQVEGERHRDGPLEVGGREGREGVGGAPKGRAGTKEQGTGRRPRGQSEGKMAGTAQLVAGEWDHGGLVEEGEREAGVGVRGALEGRLRGTLMRHRTGVEGGGWKEGGGGNPMEYRRKGEVGRVAHQLRCSERAEASWNGRPGAP